jgi:hypothetical protein
MQKYLVVFIAAVLLSGCQPLRYEEFYKQVAPMKYPETQKVMVFEYSNVDLDEIYQLLFSDFLIIGKSSFNGPYENPERSRLYAKSIGADFLITSSQFKETRTSFINISTTTVSKTYINGHTGNDSFHGTATTYGTQTTTMPVIVNRYAQKGMYLKNINKVDTLWEKTKEQYQETGKNKLPGTWINEDYEIEILKSGDQMAAFIKNILQGDPSWLKGQLKMFFGVNSGVGIYLMGNKTPIPANISVNKFGHLEVKLLTNSEVFSFAKKPCPDN